MFAPDHQAVADELLRVCRPGGTIGVINFTPEGLAVEFFATFAPLRAGASVGSAASGPVGGEGYLRELLGDRAASLELTRMEYVERAESPSDYCQFFKRTFGPVVALYASVADKLDGAAALDRDFLEYATRPNRGAP